MAKIRCIIIEGEMSPRELKEYSDAFWYGTPATSQRAVASTEVDLRDMSLDEIKANNREIEAAQDAAPAPVPVPVPVPVQVSAPAPAVVEAPAPAPAPAPVPAERMERLLACKRGVDFVSLLIEEGKTTLEDILAECRALQPYIPRLQALGAGMEDRMTRTFEGMQ